jgi:hypothetical protein
MVAIRLGSILFIQLVISFVSSFLFVFVVVQVAAELPTTNFIIPKPEHILDSILNPYSSAIHTHIGNLGILLR